MERRWGWPIPVSSSAGARSFADARRKPSSFNATIEYFSGLQAEGTIESFEPVFLEPHGGDLSGFFFIRGDAERLSALRIDEDFDAVIQKATLIADRVGVVGAVMGAALERQVGSYVETIAEFA